MIQSNRYLIVRYVIITVIVLGAICANSQKSYKIPVGNGETGDILYVDLDDEHYWVLQALPSGAPITGFPIMRVTTFDACGPVDSREYTNDLIFGISNFYFAFEEGDSVRIIIRNSTKTLHSSNEIGIFSIHRENFGHRYNYIRADNTIHCRSLFPIDNNKFFAQTFLSYTDRPSQYGSLVLNSNFEIEHMFENFSEGAVTGGSTEVDDGIITSTSTKIYKLDKQMNLIWLKEIESKHFIGNFINTGDGIILRAYHFPSDNRELTVVKMDYDGNLIWQSSNFNFNDKRYLNYKMEPALDENAVKLAVQKLSSDHPFTDELVIYTIDINTGNVISSLSAFGNNVVPRFQLEDYNIISTGSNSLFVKDDQDQHIIWNVSEEGDCAIAGIGEENEALPFILKSIANVSNIDDNLYTGSYVWESSVSSPLAELFCSSSLEVKEILPSDTILCEELSLVLDVSEIKYPIIWEDGTSEKIRTIEEEGIYSYQIDHCELDFEESVLVTAKSCECKLYYPSVFSPNGDGINDEFVTLHNCEDVNGYSLIIYDRWGELVFQSNDAELGWNGKFRNANAPAGVYTYVSQYDSNFSSKVNKITGTISLIH